KLLLFFTLVVQICGFHHQVLLCRLSTPFQVQVKTFE
uniref:Uncharacterized protein n=1 Tax=Cucumis melo TaxID=3656 RepID=A0A9I9E1U1_CUCME